VTLAVDSSALLAIFKGEPTATAWMELIIKLAPSAALVANDIVWAEVAPYFSSSQELRGHMDDLGVVYDPVSEETAFRAGQSFALYRRAGGPREHLIPDFLIAAHALYQADGLIAADRGYLRRYFKRLRLHTL
jgi:predicted nucleic acid-binding protein